MPALLVLVFSLVFYLSGVRSWADSEKTPVRYVQPVNDIRIPVTNSLPFKPLVPLATYPLVDDFDDGYVILCDVGGKAQALGFVPVTGRMGNPTANIQGNWLQIRVMVDVTPRPGFIPLRKDRSYPIVADRGDSYDILYTSGDFSRTTTVARKDVRYQGTAGGNQQGVIATSGVSTNPTFRLKDGTTLQNARVLERGDDWVKFYHRSGIAVISRTNIPDEVCTKLGIPLQRDMPTAPGRTGEGSSRQKSVNAPKSAPETATHATPESEWNEDPFSEDSVSSEANLQPPPPKVVQPPTKPVVPEEPLDGDTVENGGVSPVLERLFAVNSEEYQVAGFGGWMFGTTYDEVSRTTFLYVDTEVNKNPPSLYCWRQIEGVHRSFAGTRLFFYRNILRGYTRTVYSPDVDTFLENLRKVLGPMPSSAVGDDTSPRYCFPKTIVFVSIGNGMATVSAFDRAWLLQLFERNMQFKRRIIASVRSGVYAPDQTPLVESSRMDSSKITIHWRFEPRFESQKILAYSVYGRDYYALLARDRTEWIVADMSVVQEFFPSDAGDPQTVDVLESNSPSGPGFEWHTSDGWRVVMNESILYFYRVGGARLLR